MMVTEPISFVGIDVGKFTCVAAVHGRAGCVSFAPDAAGIARLLSVLQGLPGAVRVGLEASGGYEAVLWEALEAAGVHVRQLAPARVCAYGHSLGRSAKTDAGDAGMIAAYLAANPEAGRQVPLEIIRELRALSVKRRQLVDMRSTLSCQMKQARHSMVSGLDTEMMGLIQTQIAAVEATIARLIATDSELAVRHRLLLSIPGIGAVSAMTLLAEMPELGSLRPGAAASLAGLAPFNRDSGTKTGKRFIQGGRGEIRHALYMAALSASRFNPSLKAFAERLKAKHKPGKQVVIAVARKLVELANVILARQTEWVKR